MPDRLRHLTWTVGAAPRSGGGRRLDWPDLQRKAARCRGGGMRTSLGNPAGRLIAVYGRHARVTVDRVVLAGLDDLKLLLGFVLEPAFRAGCTLAVAADRPLEALDPGALVEPEWGCPWTLERVRHLVALYADPVLVPAPIAVTPWRRLLLRLCGRGDGRPRPAPRLDPFQNAAVAAGDGVVQVIAPAGSGKTTVLVERVRELHRRGAPTDRILCTTFNRDACVEMAARLEAQGLGGVTVRSFHGLGLDILKAEGRLRRRLGPVEPSLWDEVAARAAAAAPGCGPFDGAAAQAAVEGFKLGTMIGVDEALARARGGSARARAEAGAFALYDAHLRREGQLDLDDLIAASVALLQQDPAVRARWQGRFERVLVDEYQDIEPAQARLVGLLAAPHDSLFCVGDEDQCIYAWRRASVRRVIDLDQVYPGLERYPLARNYRCGRSITAASRRLIGHNRERFTKPLRAGVRERGQIRAWSVEDLDQGAILAARLLAATPPERAVVLARTGRLLEQAAAGFAAGDRPGFATVHGSKGREWDHVVLFGVDRGRFPLGRAVAAGELEDERRLFYVALTRARRRLDLICTEGRPSRFLAEAGLRTRRPRQSDLVPTGPIC